MSWARSVPLSLTGRALGARVPLVPRSGGYVTADALLPVDAGLIVVVGMGDAAVDRSVFAGEVGEFLSRAPSSRHGSTEWS